MLLSAQRSSETRTAGEQMLSYFSLATLHADSGSRLTQSGGGKDSERRREGSWQLVFFFAGSGYALDTGHGRWGPNFLFSLGALLLRPLLAASRPPLDWQRDRYE